MNAVELFAGLDTPTISDAMDKLGVPGQCFGIAPLHNNARCLGPAYTVRFVPASKPVSTVGDMQEGVPEGAVVVIDNDGRTDCTIWGDILTELALIKGWSGAVIDGVCRDVGFAIEKDFGIFSRGRFMRTGKDRVELDAINETVSIGGVKVKPGDIVIGDSDGVIVVPKEHAAEVSKVAWRIAQSENAIRNEIRKGTSLMEARKKFGYHTLQRHDQ
jgi:regulator of RNase E activity RraA